MRTSLNEIREIESFLQNRGNMPDRLVLEAKMLIDKNLEENIKAQKQVYQLIKMYGRNQLKNELQEVHNELFQKPEHQSFRQSILNIFRG